MSLEVVHFFMIGVHADLVLCIYLALFPIALLHDAKDRL